MKPALFPFIISLAACVAVIATVAAAIRVARTEVGL